MANVVMAQPNHLWAAPRFAVPSVSGGAFLPESPLANILQRNLKKTARSVDVAPASTRFWVDLAVSRQIKVIAFPVVRGVLADGSTFGDLDLTCRVRVFSEPSLSSALIHDSGVFPQFARSIPRGSAPSTHPGFMTGKITPEEADRVGWRWPVVTLSANTVLGRHLYVEFDASGSDLVHLDISPMVVAPGYQPSINMAYGAGLAVEDLTAVQETDSGAEYFDERPKRRVWQFTIDHIPENEAHVQLLELTRRGVSTPLFFIFNPDDLVHRERRSFLGRLRRLSPLEYPSYDQHSMAFEVAEVLE